MRVPFIIYAGFESFTQKMDNAGPRDNNSSYTFQYEKHSPSGFCYFIKCSFDESYDRKVIYTKQSEDEDVSQKFVERLEYDITKLCHEFKFPKKMVLTEEDEANFEKATKCHICDKLLGKDRFRDHCHLTGRFRGAAHNGCNINYQIPKLFPVIFHNLSGYDSHLFIKNLETTAGNISCIPNNEEKYISFTKQTIVDTFSRDGRNIDVKRDIRFIDSFRFMASGLSALVDDLDEFPILSNYFKGRQLQLLRRKRVYPYAYVDCLSKLEEKQLPPIRGGGGGRICDSQTVQRFTSPSLIYYGKKLLAMRGLDLPTFGSTEQSFTNTPRTRRCNQWCIDGIKRKDCCAIHRLNTAP